ncbi:MAG: hypothetical protein B7Z70_02450 [Acidithiobacillus ferrivorans]|uniref:Glutaredoxin domain-containing protein n=1 Tax=Acidithiobacillus ferrivorans TaxID=160808 RepID=A0A257TCE4_9PROT|nr:MAG: hypothetical protein B7Z70_02450 [Acidithiobacillus ferrivorans]
MMKGAAVRMYATGVCPYCHRAEALLRSKGVTPEIIRVDRAPRGPGLLAAGRGLGA